MQIPNGSIKEAWKVTIVIGIYSLEDLIVTENFSLMERFKAIPYCPKEGRSDIDQPIWKEMVLGFSKLPSLRRLFFSLILTTSFLSKAMLYNKLWEFKI